MCQCGGEVVGSLGRGRSHSIQDGNTALILGARARHLLVNEVLIASGAAVYATDNVRERRKPCLGVVRSSRASLLQNDKSALDYVEPEIAAAMRVRVACVLREGLAVPNLILRGGLYRRNTRC